MSGPAAYGKLKFGPFELSIGERLLRREGVVLPLGSRALDILNYLAERPGELIAKQAALFATAGNRAYPRRARRGRS